MMPSRARTASARSRRRGSESRLAYLFLAPMLAIFAGFYIWPALATFVSTVCRVLDIVEEERLLLKGSDTCGYYAGRSWKKASKRVNEELAFAQVVGGLVDVAIGDMREDGASVQVVEDNASNAKPVDFSAALAREEALSRGADDMSTGGGEAPGGEGTTLPE